MTWDFLNLPSTSWTRKYAGLSMWLNTFWHFFIFSNIIIIFFFFWGGHYSHHTPGFTVTWHFFRSSVCMPSYKQSIHHFFYHSWGCYLGLVQVPPHNSSDHMPQLSSLILSGIGTTLKAFLMSLFITWSSHMTPNDHLIICISLVCSARSYLFIIGRHSAL